ncbi:tRNA synthetases class I (M)-domain-containing protein, partial [Entophlyctis helioformis]
RLPVARSRLAVCVHIGRRCAATAAATAAYSCTRRLSSARPACAPAAHPVYITSPIFYVNSVPHIGHLYTAVLCDTLKRWHDFKGTATLFSTGTDEHGLKIQEAAEAANIDPQAFCDRISGTFKTLFDSASVAPTDFIRTTEPRHYAAVEHLWKRLEDAGFIYKGTHEGWYCVSDETFYPDAQVHLVSVNGKDVMVSKETGKLVEWTAEENYKFKLSAFKDKLIEWLESDPKLIVPEGQYNFVLSQLKSGDIGDLSISRLQSRLKWGIPVPGDPKHVIYVWLDALTNYLTVTGYPWTRTSDENAGLSETEVAARHGWPAHVHVVGKDIIKFHAIYWPAFLMAAGLPLPRRIISHGHWLVGQQKMSKSLGNVVDPHALLAKWGVDAIRYFLMRDGGIQIDPEFSHATVLRRYKNFLGSQLGNLLMRATSARINPSAVIPVRVDGPLQDDDKELLDALSRAPDTVDAHFNAGNLPEALKVVEDLIGGINKYWTEVEPWRLVKETGADARHKHATLLYVTYETLRVCGLLLQPVMPGKAAELLDTLGVHADQRSWRNVRVGCRYGPEDAHADRPAPTVVGQKVVLFPRIDE